MAEARILTEGWRIAYNAEHPRSALGYRSPDAFALAMEATSTLTPAHTTTVPGATSHRLPHAVDRRPGPVRVTTRGYSESCRCRWG